MSDSSSFSWEQVAASMGVSVHGPFNLGAAALRAAPKQEALYWYGAHGEEETLTYGDLSAGSARFANMLQNLGVSLGDRVLFLTRNLPELVMGILGTLRSGSIPGTLSIRKKPDTWHKSLAASGAKVLVLEPESKPLIDKIRKRLPNLWHVIVLQRAGMSVKMGGGDFLWEDYFDPAAPSYKSVPCSSDSPAFLSFGRGGSPVFLYGHRAALGLRYAAREVLPLSISDSGLLVSSPGDPDFISMAVLTPLLANSAQILIEDPIHFRGYGNLISECRARLWYSGAGVLETLLRRNPPLADFLRQMELIVLGEPLHPEFMAMASSSFAKPPRGLWGIRSTGACQIAQSEEAGKKPGAYGRPLAGRTVALQLPKDTASTPTQTGSLAVKVGPGVPFVGLWKEGPRPEIQPAKEWLRTSSRARRDADGCYWPAF